MGDGCLEYNGIIGNICFDVFNKEYTSNEAIVDEIIRRTREEVDKIDNSNIDKIAFDVWDNLINAFNISADIEYITDALLQKAVAKPETAKKELKNINDIDDPDYNITEKTFIDEYYGVSDTREQMLEKFTRDFIRSTLVDFEGKEVKAVDNIAQINTNLIKYQESLYRDLKEFIEADKDLHIYSIPDELFDEENLSNFKVIFEQLDNIFKQKTHMELARLSQSNSKEDKRLFDAINKYFILKHFDQLVFKEFSSFLNIGDIYFGKHIKLPEGRYKYTLNSEHDYQNAISWRQDEKATPREVMSHHLQYIIRTIPYIDAKGTLHGYLDTDLVIYGVKALKDIYLKDKIKDEKVYTIKGLNEKCKYSKNGDERETIIYTDEEKNWLRSIGKRVKILDIVDHLRDNPQIGYSVLLKVINSDFFKSNNSDVFLEDLTNIFNSLYRTIFNNNRVLDAAPDIYQELIHFLDFTTNMENSLYYLDDNGNWLIRTMNPMNIETNKYILRNSINSAHASGQMDFFLDKYLVKFNEKKSDNKSLDKTDKNVTMEINTRDGYKYIVTYFPARSGEDRVKVIKEYYEDSELVEMKEFLKEDYYNFKEYIKDAIQINLTRDKDLEEEIFRDLSSTIVGGSEEDINVYTLILQKLLSLSATTFGNAFIMRKSDNLTRKELDQLASKWGLKGRTKKDSDITFRSNLGTYNIIGKSESYNLGWLAARRGIAKRLASKSTIYTAEKTTIASNSLSNYSAERRNQYAHFGSKSAVRKNMLIDLLGWGVSREADLVLSGKLNHTFNFNELLYSSFCIDFLNGYKNPSKMDVCRFMEAVNSDKPNSPRIDISRDEIFDKEGKLRDAEYFYAKTEETFRDIYATTWKNVLDDYSLLSKYVLNSKASDGETPRFSNILDEYRKLYNQEFRIDAEDDFEKFNGLAVSLGTNGNDLLHNLTLDYNKRHFNNPIAIIENVHKRSNKDANGNTFIELNKAFITNLLRFNLNNPDEKVQLLLDNLDGVAGKLGTIEENGEIKSNAYWVQQLNLANYFHRNEVRLVDDLLTEGAKINIKSTGDNVARWKQILSDDRYFGWSKENGDLVFAKIYMTRKSDRKLSILNVNDYADLIGFTSDGITSDDARFDLAGNLKREGWTIDGIDIHPALRSWTAADGYYSGKYLTANVGLTVFSDAKGAKNSDYEEEGAVGDYVKRNVINTATMKQYQLNTLKGITEFLNIAIVEDIKALLNNIATDEAKYKVWDGATFTNSFLHYWENDSLSGSITGFTKKPIMHHYFDKYAAGYLQKTASFAINNEKMRDSILYRAMHYKTSNMSWRDADGRLLDVDITKSYLLETEGKNKGLNKQITYDDCYYKKNGSYYNIYKVVKLPSNPEDRSTWNKYEVYVKLVSLNGKTLKKLNKDNKLEEIIEKKQYTIKSNYDLWAMLGGYDSVSFDRNEKKFVYSENSIKKVAQVANLKGIVQEGLDPNNISTQQGVYLFMKHSNIHYIATEGAVKKGAANINKYESLKNSDSLNFFKVRGNLFGVQLDPTHEADNAEVSLMTQVMSGLADRGFTTEAVLDVYNALGRLAREAIQEDIDKYKELLGESLEYIEDKVANEIMSAFRDLLGSANNLINAISLKLTKMRHNEKKNGVVPWSDTSIFNLIVNSVTSTLNKMAIRVKSFGTLSVLNPSHDTILLFDGKKLSLYSSPKVLHDKGVDMKNGPVITNHKLYLGHWYQYNDGGVTKYEKLTLDKYYEITKKLDLLEDKTQLQLREALIGEEREITGDELDKDHFGLFKLYTYNPDDPTKPNELITFINGKIYDPFNGLTINAHNYLKVVKVNLLARDLDTYNVFINEGEHTLYDLKSVHDRYLLRKDFEEKGGNRGEYVKLSRELLRLMQEDLVKIKEQKKSVQFISNRTDDKGNNIIDDVIASSHEVHEYGLFLPMIYKSKFGLKDTDELSDILEDKEFFFKRLLENYIDADHAGKAVLNGSYDFVIKNLNNKNIYLQTKQSNIQGRGLKKMLIRTVKEKDGKVYRLDQHGNKMYQMSSELDTVYIDYKSANLGEIIVTDDAGVKFYIDRLAHSPSDILVYKTKKTFVNGGETLKSYKERINKILESTDLFKNNLDFFIDNDVESRTIYDRLSRDDTGFIMKYLYDKEVKGDLKKSGMLNAINSYGKLGDLWRKSQRIRTSFILSLKYLGARIPAQGMLSFMTMRAEGFTNVGVNDCYVSDMQFWLQGSDLDIDKVTLMGSSFNNFGEYRKWSKYIRLLDSKEFEITANIKFPTGKKVDIIKSLSLDYKKYASLFTNNKLNVRRPRYKTPYEELKPEALAVINKEAYEESIEEDWNDYYDLLKLMVEMINRYSDGVDGDFSDKALLENIKTVVDDHNTLEIRNVEEVLMNLVLYRATQISKDIVNIIPSLNPIDVVSEPLKIKADESNFGRKDKYNRYGNAVVKLKQLLINQTGKLGIAITAANGIKTFFALTQYYNQAVREKQISDKDLKDLEFKITIAGEEYHTIANINKIFDDIIVDPNLKKKFNDWVEKGNSLDADSVISGIMTLATDNAKELKLAKLNASPEVLSLYLYGVTIGVPFDTLADIFTSNTADVLNKRMHKNIFEDENDIKLGKAIKSLRTGPWQPKGYDDILFLLNYKYDGKVGTNPEKSIASLFKNLMEHLKNKYSADTDEGMASRKRIFAENVEGLLKAANLIRELDGYSSLYKEEVIQYIKDMYRMYGNGRFERDVLSDIEKLLKGSQEIGVLRSLILNQGVKVLLEDKLSFYDSFASIIENRLSRDTTIEDLLKSENKSNLIKFYNNNKKSFKIDFIKYCTDEKYKNLVIEAYEDVKHTINPLRVIDKLPHFKEYLNTAADDALKLRVSSVFNAIREQSSFVFDLYLVYSKDLRRRYYKRMLDFFTKKVQDEFLKLFRVTLDEGTLILSGNNYIKAKGRPVVTLGTAEGNTAFKLWVESKFIPSLLTSNLGYFLSYNTFINDLVPKLYTKTLSGNRIRSISLPSDMIPKTELELKIFTKYLMDYKKTANLSYLNDENYSIADILYLYNMITYGNANNTIALTPITDILYTKQTSIADKYSNFLANFDSNNRIHVKHGNSNIKIKDGDIIVSEDELLQQVAPDSFEIKNKKDFRGPYVRIYNNQTGDRELHKLSNATIEADKKAKLDKEDRKRRSMEEEGDVDTLENDIDNDVADEDEFNEMADNDQDMDMDDLETMLDDDDMDNDTDDEGEVYYRKTPLNDHYEPVSKALVDKTALSTLGRYLKDTAKTATYVPDILDSKFTNYVKDLVESYNKTRTDFRLYYLHNNNYDNVEVKFVLNGKKYTVTIDGIKVDVDADVEIRNRVKHVNANLIELVSNIRERIREKTKTKCKI